MSTSVEIPLPGADIVRHPTLDRYCAWFEAIIHGREAEELLKDPESIPEGSGVALLPAWQWAVPLIDVGRKGVGYDGRELLLPVRNEWTGGSVQVISGESRQVSCRSLGLGHRSAGQTQIVQRAGFLPVTHVEGMPSMAEPVFVGRGSRFRVISALKAVAEAAKTARWELLTFIEPEVRTLVARAHSAVSHEMGLHSGNIVPMLDEQGLESVVNTMLLGYQNKKDEWKPGSVFRLIDLCLAPDCFQKVEPLRYMTTHLRRDAESAIRRKIGDPHIGPKVREVARRNPAADIDEIVDLYRQVYPRDKLSTGRAQEALSAGPDAMAGACGLTVVESDWSRGEHEFEEAA